MKLLLVTLALSMISFVTCRPRGEGNSDVKTNKNKFSKKSSAEVYTPRVYNIEDGPAILEEPKWFSEYNRLVRANEFRKALTLVCEKFSIKNCESFYINIKLKGEPKPKARAVTSQYNNVTLYNGAFYFYKEPHAGWLAAVIQHELVHTKQSRLRRAITARTEKLVGWHSVESELETEAWKSMYQYERQYYLRCALMTKIYIEERFYKSLGLLQRYPKDKQDEIDNFLPAQRFIDEYRQKCRERQTKWVNEG